MRRRDVLLAQNGQKEEVEAKDKGPTHKSAVSSGQGKPKKKSKLSREAKLRKRQNAAGKRHGEQDKQRGSISTGEKPEEDECV